MSEAQKESDDARRARSPELPTVAGDLEDLEKQLAELGTRVGTLKRRIAVGAAPAEREAA